MKRLCSVVIMMLLALGAGEAAAFHDWNNAVPPKERARENPYAADAKTLAAGAQVYRNRCASCHGEDAMGRGRRPGLRTAHVRNATDGEILWLLENGELRYGMPSWSSLPEEQRWQVERYVKSLPAATPVSPPAH
jgi:mono/diheme cytochrome c family protein